MKRFLQQGILIAALTVTTASALDMASLLPDSTAKELLGPNCIQAETSGFVPVRFDTACRILNQSGLYQAVQAEYARSISRNGTVEYPIVSDSPGRYHYINAEKKRTDITELYRRQTGKDQFDVILIASGRRFFGAYDVLVHIQLLDAPHAGIVYLTDIHAYPHNGPIRFLARKLGLVEHYFKKNTDDITWVARRIATGLCARYSGTSPAYAISSILPDSQFMTLSSEPFLVNGNAPATGTLPYATLSKFSATAISRNKNRIGL